MAGKTTKNTQPPCVADSNDRKSRDEKYFLSPALQLPVGFSNRLNLELRSLQQHHRPGCGKFLRLNFVNIKSGGHRLAPIISAIPQNGFRSRRLRLA